MTFNMKQVLFPRMLMCNPDSAKEIKKKSKQLLYYPLLVYNIMSLFVLTLYYSVITEGLSLNIAFTEDFDCQLLNTSSVGKKLAFFHNFLEL